MTHTIPQLQKFLAGRLKEEIRLFHIPQIGMDGDGDDIYRWVDSNGEHEDDWFNVKDAEWPNIVSLVEKGLDIKQSEKYYFELLKLYHDHPFQGGFQLWCILKLDWQTRATALMSVLGKEGV